MSERRKQEIYCVAQQLNLFIIEDDPYYFVRLGPFGATTSEAMDGCVADTASELVAILHSSHQILSVSLSLVV
jgi:DNA-binding transcriptional MocR family regulator